MLDQGWHLLRNLLRRFVPFTDAELDMLYPSLTTLSLKRGTALVEEGKVASMVRLVVNGAMRHYYTRDGVERTTYFYFEGHLVSAYISCITGQPSQLTIEAITDCELLMFPYATLAGLFSVSHTWERFGRLLAEYLAIGLEERLATQLLLSPEERSSSIIPVCN